MAIDSERADGQRAITRDLLRKLRTEDYSVEQSLD